LRISPRRLPTGIAATAATAVLIPAAANASLNSVAVSTQASGHVLVLDVASGSTSPGAGVIQWYGSGGSNQRWNFVDQPDGNVQIVSQKTGMCLTTDGIAGHQLFQWYCNSPSQQEWHGPISGVFDPDFFYKGKNLKNPASGLAIDVEGGSRWAGARIIGWYPNGGDNQRFKYYQL
jgi:hypothetical protein